MTKRWGATPEDWAKLKKVAFRDLLPVVSNPHIPISERSRMKQAGKTPSVIIEISGERRVIGMKDWTDHETTVRNLDAWKEEPDYGICIQTRRIRALDCDVPDQKLSAAIVADFLEELSLDALPRRYREGTGKQLLAFVLEGEFSKRSFVVKEWREFDEEKGKEVTKRWLVEFLAEGQQFVAVGTHTSGGRYEWEGGLPSEIPVISAKAFERAWAAIKEKYELEGSEREMRNGRAPTLAEDLEVRDPVAEHLIESDWPTYDVDRGKLYLDCPWKDEHSSDNGETETAWLLAGTGRYRNGHFACRHAGCASRKEQEFFDAVGYRPTKASDFENLSKDDAAVEAYAALAPAASPKSKELKAKPKALAGMKDLPLPGFDRDVQGRIETNVKNLTRALAAPQAVGCWIAYDEFRGELMYAEAPEEWQPLDDGMVAELIIRIEDHGFKDQIGIEKLRRALDWIAKEHRFDSAIKWLTEVVPPWDGVPRVRTFWPRYMRTKDTPYTRALGDYTWTAQADRILNPGCQVDMVPVMVSPEGYRKTSVVAALAPDRLFFSEFSLADDDKELARKMRGALVGELAELRGVSARDADGVLSWVTRRDEEWTPKFKEYAVRLARRLVFYGTTNDYEFMKPHMGKRRWLPVEITERIDMAALVRDRLQLWAEARDLFLCEGQLYEEVERLAKAEHQEFRETHKWEAQFAAWLDDRDEDDGPTRREQGVRTDEVIAQCLGISASRVRKSDQMDAAEALKACGMELCREWIKGKTTRVWRSADRSAEVGRGRQELHVYKDKRTKEGRS